MTVRFSSVAFQGFEAVPVEVEVQKSRGLFGQVSMVGLPSHGVRESRDRVRAAVQASDFPFPQQAMIINFAPGDLKKEGSFYDLPIALGILASSGIIEEEALRDFIILGELALDGSLRPVPGTLSAAILARETGRRGLIVPPGNSDEARLVPEIEVLTASHLRGAARLANPGLDDGPPPDGIAAGCPVISRPEASRPADTAAHEKATPDFRDVVGQESAKEALVVAAAGGHNILMIGPPGSGKTMLATRLPSVLPPLDISESLEVSRIHSFARNGISDLVTRPPFRAPHHTVSYAGLVGGGQVPRPGEISLAHRGILFLDELPEFGRRILETLRQPLEEGVITIARASATVTLPARITLIASMNPCPCGFSGDSRCRCVCTPWQIQRYVNRISGPIFDRLDLHIEVPPVSYELLGSALNGLTSANMAERVVAARERQTARLQGSLGRPGRLNAHMSARLIRKYCTLTAGAEKFLEDHLRKWPLSARGYTRILKVARTLADLDGRDKLNEKHIQRAVIFRTLDRGGLHDLGGGQK